MVLRLRTAVSVVAVLLCVISASIAESERHARDASEEKRGVLLTVPRVVRPGGTERACFTLHHFSRDIVVDLDLFIVQNANTITSEKHTFHRGKGDCFDMQIPSLERSEITLVARAVSRETTPYVFQSNTTLGVKQHSLITFIQTDKPIYKPGQTVRFRILSVESDLKPRQGRIEAVWIENPSGVRMAQWLNVETEKGLASLSMELSDEPTLGQWKIVSNIGTQTQEQTFKVDEYVLPKFEVTVQMPNYVLVNAEEVNATICARYTYGKPVKGYLTGSVCVTQQYYYRRRFRPCFNISRPIDGCTSVRVNTTAMQLQHSSYSLMDAKLNVTATVVENATYIEQNTTVATTKVEQHLFKIDLTAQSPSYFKPNLPYHGKILVRHPDDSPAFGELVEITVSNYEAGLRVSKNYTSNERGEIEFSLPPVNTTVPDFSINARLPGYQYQYQSGVHQVYVPTAHSSVKQWFSPSGSFVQVEPIYTTAQCGTNLNLNVTYTTDLNTNYKFYYQVLSRGSIVYSGSKRHHLRRRLEPVDDGELLAVASGRRRQPGRERGRDRASRTRVQPKSHVAHLMIDVPISHEMAPLAKVLVFYLTDAGETVADSIHVPVQQCLENKVEVSFDAAEKRPGQSAMLRVQSDPESLCAVGVVDKSVHVMGGSNQLTVTKVFEELRKFQIASERRVSWRSEDEYCMNKMRKQDESVGDGFPIPPAPPMPPRPGRRRRPRREAVFPEAVAGEREARSKRSVMWPGRYHSKYVDSMKAFKKASLIVVSDLSVATRPCTKRDAIAMPQFMELAFDAAGPPSAPIPQMMENENNLVSDEPKEETLDLRNYFPETWLWELYHTGDSGRVEVTEALPHTITEWVASAVCTNEASGLGVAPRPAVVRTFQPFFASFTLPYSVIRGETVPVKVTVFNYMQHCLVVRLQLDSSESFRVNFGGPRELCVCGNQAETHTYDVTALELGEVNVTVRAESIENSFACGNKIMAVGSRAGARDAVTRQLLVEPEGVEKEYTFSNFMCPSENGMVSAMANLDLPSNLVSGSARAQVSAIGDVMGPSLSGLDKLLRLPTGCGEQNMLGFTPNIYVLQYLTSTNQLTPEIESKAKSHMKTGYQRELTYRHDDGSFSAFGKSDSSGSMWLTAFVVKSFSQAKPYIFIDEADLQRSIEWFKGQQLENGCFPQVGRVIHKDMKGGLQSGGSLAGLTAYVLAAMLEAGVQRHDPAVHNALLCLDAQSVDDVYTMSLMAYAYTLYDRDGSRRRNIMERLNQRAVNSDGTRHWTNPAPTAAPETDGWVFQPYHQAASSDVEMTAYALMAHVINAPTNGVVGSVLPIVKWLTKQRNAHGGFSSTQDTIVALQALADYAALVYGGNTSLTVEVSGTRYGKTFMVDNSNSLLLQRDQVPLPNRLDISAQGTGCALVQANVKYNIPTNSTRQDAFTLETTVSPMNNNCMKRTLNICVTYTGADQTSNMAVVSVKMVTGWLPHKLSIQELKQNTALMLKRYEIDQNWVHLYFDEFDTTRRCLSFQVEQDLRVNNAKPGIVHVYDYYDTDKSRQVEYSIRTTCGTKEELPHLSQSEFEALSQNDTFVGQLRVPAGIPPMREQTTQAPAAGCPVCFSSLPADINDKFCSATHVYKAIPRVSKVKLLYDLKQKGDRVNLKENARYTLPDNCQCPNLLQGRNKVLILTNESLVRRRRGRVILPMSSNVMVMPTDRRTERQLRKLHNGRLDVRCPS